MNTNSALRKLDTQKQKMIVLFWHYCFEEYGLELVSFRYDRFISIQALNPLSLLQGAVADKLYKSKNPRKELLHFINENLTEDQKYKLYEVTGRILLEKPELSFYKILLLGQLSCELSLKHEKCKRVIEEFSIDFKLDGGVYHSTIKDKLYALLLAAKAMFIGDGKIDKDEMKFLENLIKEFQLEAIFKEQSHREFLSEKTEITRPIHIIEQILNRKNVLRRLSELKEALSVLSVEGLGKNNSALAMHTIIKMIAIDEFIDQTEKKFLKDALKDLGFDEKNFLRHLIVLSWEHNTDLFAMKMGFERVGDKVFSMI